MNNSVPNWEFLEIWFKPVEQTPRAMNCYRFDRLLVQLSFGFT